ncbi:hypothetical protein CDD81_1119 [Ophiocordyceps australis]|uniref:NEDD8-activating enzyme E1 regulatory subunit n=1 Tax=Ophiocordyceps australis TaxID=1399860 RepID=A0A2C5Y0T5_9HYPO|nr:hypothetical protein CDD81_1119 [Ophiocordyceps australis]
MTFEPEAADPLFGVPSEKERKYDRQLRLWAASGQAALESAKLLLVNSGAGTAGTEVLKNLILPGIGSFTIADDAYVDQADLGVNFFVGSSWLGKSRAECCCRMLLELNPEVQGDWYPKNKGPFYLEQLLESSAKEPFAVIVYVLPISVERVNLLKAYARKNNAALVVLHSVGFYAYFRIILPGIFPIVDTHPDESSIPDLRLLDPWPELSSYAANLTKNMDSLSDHDHGHLPLVAILIHYLSHWRDSHGHANPTNYSDKVAFRRLVADSMRRDNAGGGEENFEEAVAAVMKHVSLSAVPSSLQQIFDYSEKMGQGQPNSDFWIIAKAVRRFYDIHHQLPFPGVLPDMKAESEVYVNLQKIFKSKAHQDSSEVLALVLAMPGGGNIDPYNVEFFCANARFIKLINIVGPDEVQLKDVVARELENEEMAATAGLEAPTSLVPIYLGLEALSHVGAATEDEILSSMVRRAPALADHPRATQVAQELSRTAGAELHNISAIIGGMVAQEIIKVVTKQYTPIDDTCIFDGIESRCQVLRL